MARHFAGMTGMTMDDRFGLSGWQKGALGQPVLKGALASLEGEISRVQTIGSHRLSGGNQEHYPEPAGPRADLL